jgi:WXG100 family type VII secretion target
MSTKMTLTKSELNSVIGKLENCASNLGSLLAKIDGIMSQLAIDWAGAAQAAYADAYEQIKIRSLLPVKQLLESYPQTLRQAENDLDFRDGESASAIRGKLGGILAS